MFFETVLSVGWSVGRGFSSEGNQLSCNIGTREPQYPFFCRLSFACRSRELELHKYTFLFRRRSSQSSKRGLRLDESWSFLKSRRLSESLKDAQMFDIARDASERMEVWKEILLV